MGSEIARLQTGAACSRPPDVQQRSPTGGRDTPAAAHSLENPEEDDAQTIGTSVNLTSKYPSAPPPQTHTQTGTVSHCLLK